MGWAGQSPGEPQGPGSRRGRALRCLPGGRGRGDGDGLTAGHQRGPAAAGRGRPAAPGSQEKLLRTRLAAFRPGCLGGHYSVAQVEHILQTTQRAEMILSRMQSLELQPGVQRSQQAHQPSAISWENPHSPAGAGRGGQCEPCLQWGGGPPDPLPRTGPGPPLFQHLPEVHQLLPEV